MVKRTLAAKHQKAAQLIAAGVPYIQVARKVGVSRPTVDNWRRWVEFQELVASYIELGSNDIETIGKLLEEGMAKSLRYAISILDTPAVGSGSGRSRLWAANFLSENWHRLQERKEAAAGGMDDLAKLLGGSKGDA